MQGLRERVTVDPRRATQLERPGRAAALAQVGGLDEAPARVDDRRVETGHVRRREHERAIPRVGVGRAIPALDGDALEQAGEPLDDRALGDDSAIGAAVADGIGSRPTNDRRRGSRCG